MELESSKRVKKTSTGSTSVVSIPQVVEKDGKGSEVDRDGCLRSC